MGLTALLAVCFALPPCAPGILHVFAGISDADLSDAAFYHLRGPGAFLVSASRRHGVTQFVSVTSEHGAPLAVATDLARPLGTVRTLTPRATRL